MKNKSIRELSELLQCKKLSARELAEYFLQQPDHYNAIIKRDKSRTLQAADAADRLLKQGDTHPLTGIPIIYKDSICQQGWQATAGSKILANFVAPYTATVIAQLDKVGMIPLGRANMDEFAMGSTTESSYFGPTLNPWDTERVPGGSSGGSAAAVAARLCPVALGSDTGGSIRAPAAYCGISGLKPTYGAVSRYGLIAYASSFDQVGPMAKSADDLKWVFQAMIGKDPKDDTSRNFPHHSFPSLTLKGLKIGLIKEFEQPSAPVLALLDQEGAHLVEISLSQTKVAISTYYLLTAAEASSNLQRYDGVRYGYRADLTENLEDLYRRSRSQGFGKEVKRRILMGTYVLSHGFYDAYYLKAKKIRQMIVAEFEEVLQQCDVIVSPVTPSVAPRLGSFKDDPLQMYLTDVYTILVNLAYLPSLSIPGPLSEKEKMPVGVQLIGPHFSDYLLLGIAQLIQEKSDWHRQSPFEQTGEKAWAAEKK